MPSHSWTNASSLIGQQGIIFMTLELGSVMFFFFYILLGMWLLIRDGIRVDPRQSEGSQGYSSLTGLVRNSHTITSCFYDAKPFLNKHLIINLKARNNFYDHGIGISNVFFYILLGMWLLIRDGIRMDPRQSEGSQGYSSWTGLVFNSHTTKIMLCSI